MPEAVSVVGWIHGVLFVAFFTFAFETKAALNKNFGWMLRAFIASVIPFGTFFFDKELKRDLIALKS